MYGTINDRLEDKILNYQKTIDLVARDLHMTQGQKLAFHLFLNEFQFQGSDELLYDLLIQKAIEFSRTFEFQMDLLDRNKRNQELI